MITFRYHVVTLVAVFMAIGLGVLFGATFIDQNIVDSLRASQARLGDRNETLRSRILTLENENRSLHEFTGSARDLIVGGSLEGVSAWMVSFESTPAETIEPVRETLELGGARLSGHLILSDRLDLAAQESREALAAVLGTSSTDVAALSEALVAQLATALSTASPELLSSLLASELAAAPVPLQTFGEERVLVLVGGMPSPELNERIAVPLARVLGAGQTVTAAAEPGTDLEMIEPLREASDLRLVTVDSIETPLGQAALAIGIKGALRGQFGHYGRGDGATTVLPAIEP